MSEFGGCRATDNMELPVTTSFGGLIGVTARAASCGCVLDEKKALLTIGDTLQVQMKDPSGLPIILTVSFDSIKLKEPKTIRRCRNCNNFHFLTGVDEVRCILPFCTAPRGFECLQGKNIDTVERDCFVEREKK